MIFYSDGVMSVQTPIGYIHQYFIYLLLGIKGKFLHVSYFKSYHKDTHKS